MKSLILLLILSDAEVFQSSLDPIAQSAKVSKFMKKQWMEGKAKK